MNATICTVLTPMHKRLMGLNYQLIKTLNPGTSLSWNVVYNKTLYMHIKKRRQLIRAIGNRIGRPLSWPKTKTEIAEANKLVDEEFERFSDPGEVADYIPEALLLKGYKPKQLAPQFEQIFGEPIAGMEERVHKYLASYLHAAGLNIALRESKTRYSIVVDPDFYVVKKNWIEIVLKRMQERDLAIFGAPWNPRWYQKFRNFPCAHLLVIDHEKIPFTPNLLSPELVCVGPKYVSKNFAAIAKTLDPRTLVPRKKEYMKTIWQHARHLPVEDWRQRATVGTSRDTGYKLLERARNREEFKFDMAMPVFDPNIEGFHPEVVFPIQHSPFVESFYPARRRYMPARGAYSTSGFVERGYPNFRIMNWEEFLLDDEPFAFHIRGELQRGKTLGIDMHPAWFGLCTILQKMGLPELSEPSPLDCEVASAAA